MTRPRIVIIGGGFAGYYAARSLCSTVRGEAEVVITLAASGAHTLVEIREDAVSGPGTLVPVLGHPAAVRCGGLDRS